MTINKMKKKSSIYTWKKFFFSECNFIKATEQILNDLTGFELWFVCLTVKQTPKQVEIWSRG